MKHVPSTDRYVRTLVRALQLAGGEAQLAAHLQTTPDLLRLWLSGKQAPPLKKYLAALEFVTRASSKRLSDRSTQRS